MIAASQELEGDGEEGVSKLVSVFGESMITICGIWDECATQLKAKYFKGQSPSAVYFVFCYPFYDTFSEPDNCCKLS
jgi:hypothetical protein